MPDGCIRCPTCEGYGWQWLDLITTLASEVPCRSCEGRGWIDEND